MDEWHIYLWVSAFLFSPARGPRSLPRPLHGIMQGEVWEQPSLPFLFPLTSSCIIKTQRPLDVEQSNAVKPAAQVAWSNKESVETITCM